MKIKTTIVALAMAVVGAHAAENAVILTPPPAATPRINGPGVFGVRPNSPFLYTVPATGDRPVKFEAEGLPAGLKLDGASGQITGTLAQAGEFQVTLKATNAKGSASKKFRIVCGDKICLTPPLGWNSWNCWADAVDQDKVVRSAKAMISSGLINHGWTYINIDDTWQGTRGGAFNAIQGNKKFPDMKKLCDDVHNMGLKIGIYSTPWITSYAKYTGGSSDNEKGEWSKDLASDKSWKHGKYPFAENDAKQWGAWGFDYLKYDWNPNDVPHVKEMSDALRKSGRDIVYSLSNAAPLDHANDWTALANCWRTTGDIWDFWDKSDASWRYSVSEIGFNQERWAPYSGAGHWNDPDMLVVGYVGWGPQLHSTHLTPNEQYTHITMWCMLSAPLLIGCDMERLDAFTLNLLSNDEVLALDQDALGTQAVRMATIGSVDVYVKALEDGSKAVGFFNRGAEEYKAEFNKFGLIGISGKQNVRDLWRQKDLADADGKIAITVPAHGVFLVKMTAVK